MVPIHSSLSFVLVGDHGNKILPFISLISPIVSSSYGKITLNCDPSTIFTYDSSNIIFIQYIGEILDLHP